jgi:amino acid transporter
MTSGLRRDLGTLESYAALLGILIGAGIFRVTSDAYVRTGPSVLLGYLVLAPAILATSVAYIVFVSTPLGREPGAEYAHISRTLSGHRLAFFGSWLKLISYTGACAYLAVAQSDYLLELCQILGVAVDPARWRTPIALAGLAGFYFVHACGVRWFGRAQVAMCAVLGIAIVVLVVPGLFAIHLANYRPFFEHGAGGFAAALPSLFFAYAGFESLAHAAGEVRESTRVLPKIFVRGIAMTTVVFVAMSAVAMGVLPGSEISAHRAPMAAAASVYLPVGATALVAVGAVMAVATSLNASLLVPSRLMIVLAEDGLLPPWLGRVRASTGTPVVGLTLTLAAAALLVLLGQVSLALTIAVLALVLLYALHSLTLLLLPSRNPELFAQATVEIPLAWQRAAAIVSIGSMVVLVASQVAEDAGRIAATSFLERARSGALSSLELTVVWLAVGALVYALRPHRNDRRSTET